MLYGGQRDKSNNELSLPFVPTVRHVVTVAMVSCFLIQKVLSPLR